MNYKKMIFVVLHSVALMALLTMSCPAQDKPVSVTVPYHQLNINVQYITVRINNKIDARLLVDTGASCTFLFKSLATRLHLGSDRRFDPNAPYVSLSNPPRIDRLNAMQIGNLTLHSVPVVIGYNEDNATHLPGGLDGILGMNILKNYALLLDSQKSTLTFWKGGKLSAMQRQQIGFDHSDAIPLLPGKGDERFLVQAQLGGKINENLLLDTGSPITHITASSASRLNLVSDSILQHASFYGTFVFHLAYLEPLKIGSLLTRLVVGYPDSDALPLPPLLGMDVMARYGVLFDFPAQKMYVRPQQQSMVTTPFITYPGEDFPLWQIKLNDNSSHLIGLNPGLLSQLAPEAIPGRKSLVAPPQAITAEETSTITSIIRFTDSALALDERQFQIGSLGSLASAFSGLVGWLGYDTLYRYAVQLDFSKKQMRWFSPGGLEGTNYIPPIAQRLPLFEGA